LGADRLIQSVARPEDLDLLPRDRAVSAKPEERISGSRTHEQEKQDQGNGECQRRLE
jgi:hypothetical protein